MHACQEVNSEIHRRSLHFTWYVDIISALAELI